MLGATVERGNSVLYRHISINLTLPASFTFQSLSLTLSRSPVTTFLLPQAQSSSGISSKKLLSNIQFFLALLWYMQSINIKEIQHRMQTVADTMISKIPYEIL